METLKDKKIAKLEERVSNLQAIIRHCDSPAHDNPRFDMVLELTKKDMSLKSDLAALSEQPDTAPTVISENPLQQSLIDFIHNEFKWYEVNSPDYGVVPQILRKWDEISSTANQPKETV